MVSIVIQAGGNSSRMGTDKGLARLHGRPLVEHILEQIQRLGDETLLITNTPSSYAYLNLPMFSDAEPGAGALPGLLTALQAAQYDKVLLLACDMPFINPGWLRYLLDQKDHADIIVPFWEGEFQTLQAIYTPARCIPVIQQKLAENKRRMISIFNELKVLQIPPETILQYDDGLTFLNLNTPEELAAAHQIHRRTG